MPIREYDCSKCGRLEIKQSFHEESLTKCPTCKRKITRHYSEVYASIRQDPKTLIHQADRNTQAMGKYQLEDRVKKEEDEKQEIRKRRKEDHQKIAPAGSTVIMKDDINPSIKPLDKSVKEKIFNGDNMDAKKVKDYVETGRV